MKKIILSAILLISISTVSQAQNGFLNGIFTAGNGTQLTNDNMIEGLMEGLKLGINTATGSASKSDGFFKNPEIFIPFPKEAESMKKTLEKTMKPQVDDFVMKLNRAAEKASEKAGPIFLDALKQMTFTDALTILQAKDDAATQYLKAKTMSPLTDAFAPVINDALSTVGATQAWSVLANAYNMIPFVQKVNPDLGKYTTELALVGIFKLVSQEEMKIRKDPAAFGNNVIQNVFGAFTGN
jgi:TPP-dependent indolepyruvate ferredoxin oxidoreductase alpha subunit